jgi:transcriptional regulator GlxA family with amidase domain
VASSQRRAARQPPRARKPVAVSKRVGFLIFPGFAALDLSGPMEVFAAANQLAQTLGKSPPYQLLIFGLKGQRVTSESGLIVEAHATLQGKLRLDTLIVPGGAGIRVPETLTHLAQATRSLDVGTRRVAAVCTGVYALAEAGLLDGRRVTTHWRFAGAVATRFAALDVHADAIYLRDGKYYTSAGVTAGIDLALALVQADLGPWMALQVARELVVFLRRPGGQAQYSEALQRPAALLEPFASLGVWIEEHLQERLSVTRLAQVCHLSARQFSRRFQAAYDESPAHYVLRVRVNAARRLLLEAPATVEQIAASVGFASADVMRRAFERQLGVTPTDFRERFRLDAATGST